MNGETPMPCTLQTKDQLETRMWRQAEQGCWEEGKEGKEGGKVKRKGKKEQNCRSLPSSEEDRSLVLLRVE